MTNGSFRPTGPRTARTGADSGSNLFFTGHAQWCRDLGQLLGLDVVELMIATNHQCDQLMAGFFHYRPRSGS